MPRRPKPVPTPPNSMVASAARMGRGQGNKPKKSVTGWQDQAWGAYDTVGEYRFAANWMGNVLSRVRLYVEQTTPEGDVELTEGPAVEAMGSLFNGETGQSQLMQAFGVHLTVPGEIYVIGQATDRGDVWGTFSTQEVEETAGTWKIDRGDGKTITLNTGTVDDPGTDIVIRVWRPHPRKWVEADSCTRACLPILRELGQLTKHIAATIDSRLAGAGVLAIPSEMTFTPSPVAATAATDVQPATISDLDPFTEALTEAMLTPIEDRSNAAAVVPIVIKAPGALIGNIKHLTFATPLDEKAMELRTEAIRRLALGMDMPPEVLLGLGDSNHWSAWQIDEAAMKVHVAPLCELICDALTQRWLWPVLEGQGFPPDETVRIAFDTTDLRVRPDQSTNAVLLYDRLEIDGAALRRETGFEESDVPEPDELTGMLLRFIARTGVSPEAATAAAESLGLPAVPPASEALGPVDTPVPPPPAIESRRDIPQAATVIVNSPGPSNQAGLLAAAEVTVLRAIERANNRINQRGRRKPIHGDQLDTALADAWGNVPRIAGLCGVDPDALTACLDTYARAVLIEGVEHRPDVFAMTLFSADPHHG